MLAYDFSNFNPEKSGFEYLHYDYIVMCFVTLLIRSFMRVHYAIT